MKNKNLNHLKEKMDDENMLNMDVETLFEYCRRNDAENLKILLINGADPNAKNEYGRSLLHYAVYYTSAKCLQLLLECGADPSIEDEEGNTPLHYAVYYNSAYSLQLLLERGASPSIQNRSGNAPLHYIKYAFKDRLHLLQLLLEYGAIPSIRNKNGKTFLDCTYNATHKKEIEEYMEMVGVYSIKEPSEPTNE